MSRGKLTTLIERESSPTESSGLGWFLSVCAVLAIGIGVALQFLDVKIPAKPQLGLSVAFGVLATGLTLAPNRLLRHSRVKRIIGTGNPYFARLCCALLAAIVWGVVAFTFMVRHEMPGR